jgi:hypothetical protein
VPSFHPIRKILQQRARNWIRSFAACFGVCVGDGSEDPLFCKGTADVGVTGKVAKWPSTMSTDILDFEPPIALSTPSSMPELIFFGRVQDFWLGSRDQVRLTQTYEEVYILKYVPLGRDQIKSIQHPETSEICWFLTDIYKQQCLLSQAHARGNNILVDGSLRLGALYT